MKVGDWVKRRDDQGAGCKIIKLKSDYRGIWIQVDNEEYSHDVWYDASYFKVISESR
jgi:hypothetical protein